MWLRGTQGRGKGFILGLGGCGIRLSADVSVEIVHSGAEEDASGDRRGGVMVGNTGAKRRWEGLGSRAQVEASDWR